VSAVNAKNVTTTDTLARNLDLTALMHVSACQRTVLTSRPSLAPTTLTQTVIQMMNDVQNLTTGCGNQILPMLCTWDNNVI